MHKSGRAFWENLVVAAIILVLIQTFLEDLAIVVEWPWSIRKSLVVAGFFFDLFFTVEFLIRLYSSVFRGQGAEYFFHRRGWVDFIASIPLLLFSSGPAVMSILLGGSVAYAFGSMLNVLKVVKAIRIARILRLLRVLKIFKQIKYTDSAMAQRHVAKITAITVTLFVGVVFAASVGLSFTQIPTVDRIVTEEHADTSDQLAALLSDETEDRARLLNDYAERNEDLLIVKDAETTIYTRFDNSEYARRFGPPDYGYIERGSFGFFFDVRTMLQVQSRDNLLYFAIIVLFVVILLVYYSPHFALTVTDPINVMRKGLEDPTYNYEVQIPDRYSADDVYRLADAYNENYLPLKDRNRRAGEETSSVLNFDDVKDILTED